MSRLAWFGWVLLMGALVPLDGFGQGAVSKEQMRADVRALDSIYAGHEILIANGLPSLSSRDALLQFVEADAPQNRLSWALVVHQWLRSVDDAHTRVRFELMADSLTASSPPSVGELLDLSGPWEGFAPGRGTSQCGRLAWLNTTWPWLGALVPSEMGQARTEKAELDNAPEMLAGMAVVEHGAFVRWIVQDFSSGNASDFKRSFRRCTRALRKAELPIMLDLRGNLGGFRTRRHAVLSFFLAPSEWPVEMESEFGVNGEITERVIPPMTALKVSKRTDVPLAVLVDGLSFSASLLLADAVLLSDRGRLFGIRPLGHSGGCTGSPEEHVLPGSGIVVTCPTLATSIGHGPPVPFGLPDDASPEAGQQAWTDAVRWLLSADLVSPR